VGITRQGIIDRDSPVGWQLRSVEPSPFGLKGGGSSAWLAELQRQCDGDETQPAGDLPGGSPGSNYVGPRNRRIKAYDDHGHDIVTMVK
jgi:hypothetical protein